jgi:hypothetical protein
MALERALSIKDGVAQRALANGQRLVSVFNSDGNHWVSYMIVKKGNNVHIFYKDSYGNVPNDEFQVAMLSAFSDPSLKIHWLVDKTKQQYETTHCGVFATKNSELFANLSNEQVEQLITDGNLSRMQFFAPRIDSKEHYFKDIQLARNDLAEKYQTYSARNLEQAQRAQQLVANRDQTYALPLQISLDTLLRKKNFPANLLAFIECDTRTIAESQQWFFNIRVNPESVKKFLTTRASTLSDSTEEAAEQQILRMEYEIMAKIAALFKQAGLSFIEYQSNSHLGFRLAPAQVKEKLGCQFDADPHFATLEQIQVATGQDQPSFAASLQSAGLSAQASKTVTSKISIEQETIDSFLKVSEQHASAVKKDQKWEQLYKEALILQKASAELVKAIQTFQTRSEYTSIITTVSKVASTEHVANKTETDDMDVSLSQPSAHAAESFLPSLSTSTQGLKRPVQQPLKPSIQIKDTEMQDIAHLDFGKKP